MSRTIIGTSFNSLITFTLQLFYPYRREKSRVFEKNRQICHKRCGTSRATGAAESIFLQFRNRELHSLLGCSTPKSTVRASRPAGVDRCEKGETAHKTAIGRDSKDRTAQDSPRLPSVPSGSGPDAYGTRAKHDRVYCWRPGLHRIDPAA